MTTILLIRHAAHDLFGKALAGRATGVHLNATGRTQAALLSQRVGPVHALYSGPLERARETAEPIASSNHLLAKVRDALNEIDFGAWTLRTFDQLATDQSWRRWNAQRSTAVAPGGEAMTAVQQRIVSEMERLAAEHLNCRIALVSHGDVIKAVLMQLPRSAARQHHAV